MEIIPFERPVNLPLLPSPLKDGKSKGPGFFAEPKVTAPPPVVAPALPPPSTNTFAMSVGGSQALDQLAYKDPLPMDTGECGAIFSYLQLSPVIRTGRETDGIVVFRTSNDWASDT